MIARTRLNWPLSDYYGRLLADGIEAFWPLDDLQVPTARDLSTNQYNGTMTGGVAPGKPGPLLSRGACAFNGSSAYITIPSAIFASNPPAFSVEVWVNGVTSGVLIGCQSTAVDTTPNSGWQTIIWIGQNGSVYYDPFSQDGSDNLTNGAPLASGWHQIVGTVNGTNSALYLDGALVTSSTSLPAPNYAYDVTAYVQLGVCYADGWTETNGGWFYANGTIALVSIALVQWTAAQVAAHWAAAQTGVWAV
jgi:hypothetical protein